MLGEEHLFKVDAVSLPGGGVGAVGEDEGGPAKVGGGDREHVQKLLLKDLLPKGQKLSPVGGGKVPRHPVDGIGLPGEADRHRQSQAIVEHQPLNFPPEEIPLRPLFGGEGDGGAHHPHLQRLQGVGAVRVAGPDVGRSAAGGLGFHHNGIGHHEAGKEADAEPPDVVLRDGAVGFQDGFGGLADHRQEPVDLLLGEAGSVIPQHQLFPRGEGDGDAPSAPFRLAFFSQGDGVDAVLQQLPQEDIGTFIQVVGEDIQHPPKIHLEAEGAFRGVLRMFHDDLAPFGWFWW